VKEFYHNILTNADVLSGFDFHVNWFPTQCIVRNPNSNHYFKSNNYVDLFLDVNMVSKSSSLPEMNTFPFQQKSDAPSSVSEDMVEEMEMEIEEHMKGKAVSKAIFRALGGSWQFHRMLNSRLSSMPSGTVDGEVVFSPMTNECTGNIPWTPLMGWAYSEKGTMTLNGTAHQVYASYMYTYNEETDTLDVFLASGREEKMVRGNLFVSLNFAPGKDGWEAEAVHPCNPDMYKCYFRFAFEGVGLREIEMRYNVSGPKKDYDSITLMHPMRVDCR